MLKTKKINKLIAAYLHALDKLQIIVFSAYIRRDYLDEAVAYEKSLLQQMQQLFKILKNIKMHPENEEKISRLEHLYEIIFSLDLLKSRLIDHATFEIVEKEFRLISQCITNMLIETDKNGRAFEAAIVSIEALFQATLQFVTADPLMFLFFIRDLRALSEELQKL